MEKEQKYDLVVIGGGPAGYTAALKATEYGYHTALVEADVLGGTCLNRGCIPTKTLLYSAECYQKLSSGKIPGVSAENISCSLEGLQRRKTEVVETLRQGIRGMLKKAKVAVIEAMDRLLGTMDREIGQSLKMLMKKRGVEIHTGTKVERIEAADGLRVIAAEKEQTVIAEADMVLVAVGRRVHTEGLFEEGLNLKMERGKILVNENFETSIPGIYAAGDCIGGIQLAHAAQAEAVNAVCAMMDRPPAFDCSVIPACVYTNPEIAAVGMTVEEAKCRGTNVISAKYPMTANGKTLLSGGERGFVKILADEQTGQIIGAQLMCERASDLISLFGEAIVNHLTASEMERVIYPHSTFAEGIGEALHLMHGKNNKNDVVKMAGDESSGHFCSYSAKNITKNI